MAIAVRLCSPSHFLVADIQKLKFIANVEIFFSGLREEPWAGDTGDGGELVRAEAEGDGASVEEDNRAQDQ